jgi:hypothetical protein
MNRNQRRIQLLISLLLITSTAYARGSLGLPTTINGCAVILLIPIAMLSWRDSKIISILSVGLLLSVLSRSYEPLGYTVVGLLSLLLAYAAIALPFTVYFRVKENKRLVEVAKSEVKWVRTQLGIQKIGSVIFYSNEHIEIQKEKKRGIKIMYPKKMFIFAEEVENFDFI